MAQENEAEILKKKKCIPGNVFAFSRNRFYMPVVAFSAKLANREGITVLSTARFCPSSRCTGLMTSKAAGGAEPEFLAIVALC